MEKCEEKKDIEIIRHYVLSYTVRDGANGVAMVSAYNPNQAELIFKAESNFNGVKHLIDITKIEEITPGLVPQLMAEEYNYVIP